MLFIFNTNGLNETDFFQYCSWFQSVNCCHTCFTCRCSSIINVNDLSDVMTAGVNFMPQHVTRDWLMKMFSVQNQSSADGFQCWHYTAEHKAHKLTLKKLLLIKTFADKKFKILFKSWILVWSCSEQLSWERWTVVPADLFPLSSFVPFFILEQNCTEVKFALQKRIL